MSVTYCSECGKKHEYNFAKPNFCSACGHPFGLAQLKKRAKNKKQEDYDYDEDDDDDDEDDDDGDDSANASRVPNIKKIQIEIDNPAPYNTFDLGKIVGSESATPHTQPTRKTTNRPITLEEFKRNKR